MQFISGARNLDKKSVAKEVIGSSEEANAGYSTDMLCLSNYTSKIAFI